MTTTTPTIRNIRRHNGVAGQYGYTVEVTYPDEPTGIVTFVGNTGGGPIVMVTPGGHQTFVTEPSRFGPELTPSWVRRFFGVEAV